MRNADCRRIGRPQSDSYAIGRRSRNLLVCSYMLTATVCVAFTLGCDQSKTKDSSRVSAFSSSENAAGEIFNETDNTLTLTHDFGVLVHPVENEVTHEFEIKNFSSEAWNVKKILNTCSCSVADITSPTIAPGATEKVMIAYKPIGEGCFDDSRKSLVLFNEESAPKVLILISSQVREPMTVLPQSLAWTRVGENQTKKGSFEVQNFSSKEWTSLEITDQPAWLTAELTKIDLPGDELQMRQLWSVNVIAETEGLRSGRRRGEIKLLAKTPKEEITKVVPVTLQITSAVSAIPGQLFFGTVNLNEPATKTIKVAFAPGAAPKNKDEIQFTHEFGDALQFTWLHTDGEIWELQATILLEKADVPEGAVVEMSFADPKLPKIALPVYVMANPEDKR